MCNYINEREIWFYADIFFYVLNYILESKIKDNKDFFFSIIFFWLWL